MTFDFKINTMTLSCGALVRDILRCYEVAKRNTEESQICDEIVETYAEKTAVAIEHQWYSIKDLNQLINN